MKILLTLAAAAVLLLSVHFDHSCANPIPHSFEDPIGDHGTLDIQHVQAYVDAENLLVNKWFAIMPTWFVGMMAIDLDQNLGTGSVNGIPGVEVLAEFDIMTVVAVPQPLLFLLHTAITSGISTVPNPIYSLLHK